MEVGINLVCKLRCGCGQKLHSSFPDRNTELSLERKGVSRLAVKVGGHKQQTVRLCLLGGEQTVSNQLHC